jgi:hypothetical protein
MMVVEAVIDYKRFVPDLARRGLCDKLGQQA